MLVCKDSKDFQIIRTLRSHGWVREIAQNTNTVFKFKKSKYLDKKFTFCNSGFNSSLAAKLGMLKPLCSIIFLKYLLFK